MRLPIFALAMCLVVLCAHGDNSESDEKAAAAAGNDNISRFALARKRHAKNNDEVSNDKRWGSGFSWSRKRGISDTNEASEDKRSGFSWSKKRDTQNTNEANKEKRSGFSWSKKRDTPNTNEVNNDKKRGSRFSWWQKRGASNTPQISDQISWSRKRDASGSDDTNQDKRGYWYWKRDSLKSNEEENATHQDKKGFYWKKDFLDSNREEIDDDKRAELIPIKEENDKRWWNGPWGFHPEISSEKRDELGQDELALEGLSDFDRHNGIPDDEQVEEETEED